jgi:hypothetical protein
MFALTFLHPHTISVLHSAAEGRAEVVADDGDHATEALLTQFIQETGNAVGLVVGDQGENGDEVPPNVFPITVGLSDELRETADSLLQACVDDSSSVDEDDVQEDYIFPGDVIIARFVDGSKA